MSRALAEFDLNELLSDKIKYYDKYYKMFQNRTEEVMADFVQSTKENKVMLTKLARKYSLNPANILQAVSRRCTLSYLPMIAGYYNLSPHELLFEEKPNPIQITSNIETLLRCWEQLSPDRKRAINIEMLRMQTTHAAKVKDETLCSLIYRRLKRLCDDKGLAPNGFIDLEPGQSKVRLRNIFTSWNDEAVKTKKLMPSNLDYLMFMSCSLGISLDYFLVEDYSHLEMCNKNVIINSEEDIKLISMFLKTGESPEILGKVIKYSL